jgi:hypothetical protein
MEVVGYFADTKLIPSWFVGGRDRGAAMIFLDYLTSRLADRVQLTSNGHRPYLEAVEGAFGADVDCAMLVKLYGPSLEGQKRYSLAERIGTHKEGYRGQVGSETSGKSFAEQSNLNMADEHSARFSWFTNALQKVENAAFAVALHALYCNFVGIHQTLKVGSAMDAGVTDRLWKMMDVAEMIEAGAIAKGAA